MPRRPPARYFGERPPPLTDCVRHGELVLSGLGDVVETDSIVLRRVDGGISQLVAFQKAEERRRKLGLILTAGGVLFAAVKLGFIAVPHFLRWRRSR